LLIVILFTVVTLGLSVQALTYCQGDGVLQVGFRVFFWLIYFLYLLWISVGVGCWLMLLRNLWGPKMAKRFPIEPSFICTFAVGSIVLLIWSPFWGLWKGSVWIVEQCQGHLCGDALEDEAEETVELDEGQRLVGGDSEEPETSARGAERSEMVVPAQSLTGLSKADL